MPFSLRQSIFQLWCCARAPGGTPSTVATVALAGARRSQRKLTRAFRSDMMLICVEYDSVGPDADEFDRAFETGSLPALALLLESDQVLERLVEPKHTWAEDPRTIGALAAVMFGLLASYAPVGDSEYKAEILNSGATDQLVAFIGSEEPDRVQAAVIALSYLTAECTANARAVYDAGAAPLLIKHLDSLVAGLRGAAASTLRHICVENEACCESVMGLGGMKGFVSQLDPHLDHAELLLEAVWNLEDFTHDRDGNLIERYAKLAVEQGAVEKLQKLKAVDEEEVSGAADKVLCALQTVMVR